MFAKVHFGTNANVLLKPIIFDIRKKGLNINNNREKYDFDIKFYSDDILIDNTFYSSVFTIVKRAYNVNKYVHVQVQKKLFPSILIA